MTDSESRQPNRGTYTLLIAVDTPIEIEVGAIGTCEFDEPAYCYTGSAFGTGGFSRIDRHRRLANGEHDARHWHVDYLLGHPIPTLAGVVKTHDRTVECEIADRLGSGPIAGFGASDCDCHSHLVARKTVDIARRECLNVHTNLTDPEFVTERLF